MLLHQVKTLLFPIYHHFYHVSSSVHSFSSALSLRFVWSQGISAHWLLYLVAAWELIIMDLKNDGTQIEMERLPNFLSSGIYYFANRSPPSGGCFVTFKH